MREKAFVAKGSLWRWSRILHTISSVNISKGLGEESGESGWRRLLLWVFMGVKEQLVKGLGKERRRPREGSVWRTGINIMILWDRKVEKGMVDFLRF